MDVLYLVLYIVAAVCFALAMFGWSPAASDSRRSFNLVAAGLLAWVLVPLLVHVQTL